MGVQRAWQETGGGDACQGEAPTVSRASCTDGRDWLAGHRHGKGEVS